LAEIAEICYPVFIQSKRKEGGRMAKPNVLVKISGNLLQNPKVGKWLKRLSRENSLVIIAGGGEDINKAFKERGFEIKFGPMGRITKTLGERQVARDVLEKNQALIQDLLDKKGINARAVIPAREIGTVLCLENGDVMVLSAYNGFDRIFVLTLKNKVKEKQFWIKQLAACFQHIEKGELDKIRVMGF
jgi:hypothetical protein